jgi:hypothetical protein
MFTLMLDVSWNLAFNCNISVSAPGEILIEFSSGGRPKLFLLLFFFSGYEACLIL